MFGLGLSEILFLGVLALIVIGPKELPEVARTIGRFLNELKRSTNVLSDELKQQVRIDRQINSGSEVSQNQKVPQKIEVDPNDSNKKEDKSNS